MAQTTPFSRVIDVVRPLMKGDRNLGQFTACLIDMGMHPGQGPDGERTALQLRKESTWRGFANGSASLPKKLASEIAGRWDEALFAGNILNRYEEPALNDLAGNLHQLDGSINKGNCAEGLGRLLYATFLLLSGAQPVATSPETATVERIEQAGHPYYDPRTNRIRLAEYSKAAAARRAVPDEVQAK